MSTELSRRQFNILEALISRKEALSQRALSELTGISLGTLNRSIKELSELGYVNNGTITPSGIAALEPYAAKRAIFIAAGFGSRLVPVTLNTPKPLVRVNGKRIIDTLIDAVLAAGINEIYIVRGYLAEQFDQLLYKYPMIRFLENPSYNEANNISSMMCARYLLSNSYIFEADLLLSNPAIIKKYHYCSDFLAIKKDRSDDWCFTAKDGFITGLSHGGLDCWQEVGISYWNEADGKKLCTHYEQAYAMPGGRELYLEQVPLTVFSGNYKVLINECRDEDVIEIDTFNELKALDKSYDI